jgi:cell wall-associated NlpC family hydrolase
MTAPPHAEFDRRITPARVDLAAECLRGIVAAPRYVSGQARIVTAPSVALVREPRLDIPIDTEILYGEAVTVYETSDEGWCWGQSETDGYVGFLPARALGSLTRAPTHRVSALRTFVYPHRTIKSPVLAALSMGCLLTIHQIADEFAETADGGFVFARHLVPIAHRAADFVTVAEQFVNVPYLWGGRTSLGLDCSALVQLSLAAVGLRAPRDSDMLEREVGTALPTGNGLSSLQRGDLIFWKGHVGIMQDDRTLLHANGYHMSVVSENMHVAIHRIEAAGAGSFTTVKRLC